MSMFEQKKILAIIDPETTSQPALEQAIKLAKETGSEIHALLTVYNRIAEIDTMLAGTILNNLRKPIMKEADGWLKELLETYETSGITVKVFVEWDKHPYKTIQERASLESYDLIIKTSEHHPVLKRLLFKPDDWHLIRDVHTTTLFVKEATDLTNQNIVVSINVGDDSEDHGILNNKIIEDAQTLKAMYGCELHVCSAYPTVQGLATLMPEGVSYEMYADEVRKAHQEMLHKFTEHHQLPESHAYLREGGVGLVVKEMTEQLEAPLVVVGTHSRKGIDGVFIGNSAESVLEQTTCNLLVVKA